MWTQPPLWVWTIHDCTHMWYRILVAASDTVPDADIVTLLQQQNALLQVVATQLTDIACTLREAYQAQRPPARPTHDAKAPQRRVTA